jgi:diheme cytochrome c
MRKSTIAVTVAVLAAAATLAAASEHGEREEHGERGEGERHRGRAEGELGRGRAAVSPGDAEAAALYRKECGACHLAFPPGALPAASHRQILAGLERHFGQNAELDQPVRDRIERYLVAHAAPGGAAPLRLTEAPWFERKHRRIGPAIVARPSVRSRANCAACHQGAADWDFDDDRVKIPAG